KPMLRSWTQLETGGVEAAQRTLSPIGAIKGFEPLYQLQLGLIYDKANDEAAAGQHYAKALETANEQAFRMIEIVANFYLRQGKTKEALALYGGFEQRHPRTLLARSLQQAAESGKKPQRIVPNSLDGMAEALFQLSVLLQSEASNDAALLLGRLALDARS